MKSTTLPELCVQVIGPMLDITPKMPFKKVAKICNERGHTNSKGRPILENSIPSGLRVAFPCGRYNRKDKASRPRRSGLKKNYQDPVKLDPSGVYITPVNQFQHEKREKNILSLGSTIDHEQPSLVSPKDVMRVISKEDAPAFWNQERSEMGLVANIRRSLWVTAFLAAKQDPGFSYYTSAFKGFYNDFEYGSFYEIVYSTGVKLIFSCSREGRTLYSGGLPFHMPKSGSREIISVCKVKTPSKKRNWNIL